MTAQVGEGVLGLIILGVIIWLLFTPSFRYFVGLPLPIAYSSSYDKKLLEDNPTYIYQKNLMKPATDAIAENTLGNFYEISADIDNHLCLALYWYGQSSAQGYPNAKYNLGRMYINGLCVDKNLEIGYEWMVAAKKLGYRQADDVILFLERYKNVEYVTMSTPSGEKARVAVSRINDALNREYSLYFG